MASRAVRARSSFATAIPIHARFSAASHARAREAWAVDLAAHGRQHRPGHTYQTEYVGFEHLAHGVVYPLFDSGEIAIAGVVDGHIDSPELPHRFIGGIANLGITGHVERRNERTFMMIFCNVGYLFWIACRNHGPSAAFEHEPGTFATKPSRKTGDQPNGIGWMASGREAFADSTLSPFSTPLRIEAGRPRRFEVPRRCSGERRTADRAVG